MFNELPVFGICGWSGSGKTTLLECVLPLLSQRGLRVVVVKHDVHGITNEASGKDSERIIHAGADVVVHGPDQSLSQIHDRDGIQLVTQFAGLAERYDLILIEGYKHAPWPKVWLNKSDESAPPQEIGNLAAVLPWNTDRKADFLAILDDVLIKAMNQTPIFGCILIGGKSTRMGTPKHLLPCDDGSQSTWLHRTVGLLEQFCRQVVLSGAGIVPEDLQQLPRMVDALEAEGPMAGLLAAMRWAPRASWLLAACDLPTLSCDALKWLVTQRRPGIWAVLPCLDDTAHVEPLLAWYDFRCRPILEQFVIAGDCSLHKMAHYHKAVRANVPPALISAWKDVDTSESIADYTGVPIGNAEINTSSFGQNK